MKNRQRVLLVALILIVGVISGCSGARATSSVTSVNAAPEAQATAAAQPGAPTISLTTDKTTINKDEQFKVNIDVNGVTDLYAADVRLQFDNSKLEVVDSNPNLPGTQIEIGKFLDPSSGQGFVAQNSADNAAGRISYAVTLLSPAKPVSGGGTLATITFKAKDAGAPTIAFLNALLTKQDNSTINAQSRPLGAGVQPVQPGGGAAQATAAPAPTGAAQPTTAAQPTAGAQATAAPKAAATATTGAAQPSAAQAATVVLDPASATVAAGATTQVAVKVNGVANLYGADVRLSFDASKVEVVDDDAAQAGVQMKQGDCFPAGSQTARNQADNGAGTITFASSRVSPAAPVNGSCTVITVTFRGKAAGSTQVTFSRAPQLADNNGQPINSTATGGAITVTGGAAQPTATTAPAATATTAPAPTATSVPGGPSGGTSCTYTVRAGDTLSTIALRYGTTTAALAQANGLSNPNLIRTGQTLTIPNCSGPVQPPAPGGCFTYTVRTGDTLSAIALRYGTSIPAIVQANNLSNPNYIRAGQRLVICAGPGSTPPPPPPPPSGRTYVVRLGDTLSSIALRFGTTPYELARLNGLANANLIYAGQVLRLP
ncbi:MAG: LysM peptidoglycan-binding domain-containing protein [Anaerolineae bacterium]|nr:LysM peptidoglycan-binding domain-containing protein [Anaerolineae bacterium]